MMSAIDLRKTLIIWALPQISRFVSSSSYVHHTSIIYTHDHSITLPSTISNILPMSLIITDLLLSLATRNTNYLQLLRTFYKFTGSREMRSYLLVFVTLLFAIASVSGLQLPNSPRNPIKIAKSFAKVVSISSVAFGVAISPSSASWFPSNEQKQVDQISLCQRPVQELLDQLRPVETPNAIGVFSKTQILRGGREDSAVVQNYLDTYIRPCQQKMEAAAKTIDTRNPEDKAALGNLPLLMKGHIFELQSAIKLENAKEQEKEVEEVQETLADFLRIASQKYEVTPYMPNRSTEKDLFGPLSCEYWGKVRVAGSNKCEDVTK